jgi:uncharacterized protein (TIGR03435 family)
MQETPDFELLQQYVKDGSDEAFAALVTRLLNLVYSAALRKTSNPHAAEEIAQAVFIILAKKAGELRQKTILSGWLYQTARLTASNFVRTAIRRAHREQEAYMQSLSNETGSEVWQQITPLLEDAMGQLGEKDRNALVLRFFEGKTFQEIGTAFDASDNAAKKRVGHALEKLRKYFSKRGVASTAAIIAGVVSANAIQAAPAALAKTVSIVAITKGAGASGSTLTLLKGVLKIMAWTKMKTGILFGTGVLVAAGTATVAVEEIQARQIYPWQVSRADFDVMHRTPPQVRIIPTKFPDTGSAVAQGDAVRQNLNAMGIAQSVQQIVEIAYGGKPTRTFSSTVPPLEKYDFIANLPQGSAEALQREIKRKFGVVGRWETRETDVLILQYQNPEVRGFKLADRSKGTMNLPNQIAVRQGNGKFTAFNQPLSTLDNFLENRFKIPVVDQTGLANHSDFSLAWDEPDPKHLNPEGLKQALADQLGLKLLPGREPIKMLVVEKSK